MRNGSTESDDSEISMANPVYSLDNDNAVALGSLIPDSMFFHDERLPLKHFNDCWNRSTRCHFWPATTGVPFFPNMFFARAQQVRFSAILRHFSDVLRVPGPDVLPEGIQHASTRVLSRSVADASACFTGVAPEAFGHKMSRCTASV